MPDPEIALVFSPEEWVEELHRYCVDHGGARVRLVVMEPGLALDEEFQTLVVSHRWPALTRPFVRALQQRRRTILGVYDPHEPAGAAHLTDLGVDRVISADAAMPAFVDALRALAPRAAMTVVPKVSDLEAVVGGPGVAAADWRRGRVVAVGGPSGAGATELAIQLAAAASAVSRGAVLADADELAPALAPRLGLPIEPNLRTAVDGVEYGMGSIHDSLHRHPAGFDVLTGLPNVAAWAQVRPGEVIDVFEVLRARFDVVVANVGHCVEDLRVGTGGRFGVTRAVLADADVVVGVGAGTPVGVVRLLQWVADVRAFAGERALHLVVNRAPAEPFKRGEIHDEIRRTCPSEPVAFVPTDRRLESAAWEATPARPGPFTRAVGRLAAEILPTGAPAARAARAQRRPQPLAAVPGETIA
ncbi:MAG: hypothetical protein U0V73_16600 [Acidimicrobiia bacterium]